MMMKIKCDRDNFDSKEFRRDDKNFPSGVKIDGLMAVFGFLPSKILYDVEFRSNL